MYIYKHDEYIALIPRTNDFLSAFSADRVGGCVPLLYIST